MTEKNKSAESKDKAKSTQSRASGKATGRRSTSKTAAAAKDAKKASGATRQRSTRKKAVEPKAAAEQKTAESKPAASKPAEKKGRATRTRTTRRKPDQKPAELTEQVAAAVEESPSPAESSELRQDVSAQVTAQSPAGTDEDPGESALLEWAALDKPADRQRNRRVTRQRPAVREPAKPSDTARAKDELLDIPAWPELLDDSPALAAPEPQPAPKPEREPREDRVERARQAKPQERRQRETSPEPEVELEQEELEPESTEVLVEPEIEAQAAEEAGQEAGLEEEQPQKSRRRRRRRRGRNRKQNGQLEAAAEPTEERQARPEAPSGPRGPAGRPAQDKRTPGDRQAHKGRHAPAARTREQTRPIDEAQTVIEPEEDIWAPDLEEEGEPIAPPDEKHGRLMLINVAEGEECRIAILHQKRLEELFIERASAESHVGNIYKGKITNVEPSIQAAFVDFGLVKNGFLHISDLQPQYFPGGMKAVEDVGRKTPRRDRPPIQKCLRRGQEIIVQIIKEGIGTKGPTLTTYISIPGRYLVMMPGMNRLGVSRRIEDDDARRKMRSVLDELDLPKDMGFILRTAGLDRTKRELQQDLLYLQRLWKVVARRIKAERAPCELYRESDLVIRTIRDVFSSDFARIIVDDPNTADKVRDFLSIAMPRSSAPVDLYKGHRPLFHEYKLEQEIERINSRYVPLPSGGSLVIESTEALVAIDVNSGKYREHDDAEETAYRINIEAAEEIARQLRLRDLGGLILCDLIDMRTEKHRRGVERALREALKKHKERAKCLRMSQFGIIEMTRQRMRPSIKRSIYRDCPNCRGTGLVKNTESMTLDIMRLLRLATHHDQVESVEIRVSPEVGFQLQNRKRAAIYNLEKVTGRQIVVRSDENLGPDQYSFECMDRRGGIIRMDDLPDSSRSLPEPRSKRRGGGFEARPPINGRETLEDVFD